MNKYFAKAQTIIKRYGAAAGFLAVAVIGIAATACSSTANAAVKPTWINATVSGKTVTVPISEIQKDTIVHFKINDAKGSAMNFMAYNLDGTTYARANVCPPCRSIGFNLVGNTLVCQTCGTVFNAKTGDGISGGCVNYPKADVTFQTDNGALVMNADQMNTAYQNTLAPGRP